MNIKKQTFLISIFILTIFFGITLETFCMDFEEEDKIKKEYENSKSLLVAYEDEIQLRRRKTLVFDEEELKGFKNIFAGYNDTKEFVSQLYSGLTLPSQKNYQPKYTHGKNTYLGLSHQIASQRKYKERFKCPFESSAKYKKFWREQSHQTRRKKAQKNKDA